MNFVIILLIFIFGCTIGSFLNVIILRSGKGEKITGRSYCPHCHKKLKWWELIPIISFFILRGRCSKCRAKISWQYPLVEFFTGLCFVLIFWRFVQFPFYLVSLFGPWSWSKIVALLILFIWFYFISVLIVLAVYDLRNYEILINLLIPALIIALIYQTGLYFISQRSQVLFLNNYNFNFLAEGRYFFGNFLFPFNLILGLAIYSIVLGLLSWLSKGKAMGYGDPILGLFLGALLNWPAALMALVLSFLLGGFWGAFLVVLKRKKLKSYLPFGPFLVLGALLIIFFGDIILSGYFKLFNV